MYTATWFKDTLERLLKTFVQVFLAQIIASGFAPDDLDAITDLSNLQRAAVAGIGAVLSVVFSLVSAWASSSNGTASLVPAVVDAETHGGLPGGNIGNPNINV